jgi:hypothetical protein
MNGKFQATAVLPRVPIVQEAGWVPKSVWKSANKNKTFVPAENRSLVAILSCPSSFHNRNVYLLFSYMRYVTRLSHSVWVLNLADTEQL